jgi:hypothetical protein
MHNEKNHSIKHGGRNVAKYGDLINMSCEAPEISGYLGISQSIQIPTLPGLKRAQALGEILFCALIGFTSEIYEIRNPGICRGIKVNIWDWAKIRT